MNSSNEVYDDKERLLTEQTVDGTFSTIYFGNIKLARVKTAGSKTETPEVSWYHNDVLGTPVKMTYRNSQSGLDPNHYYLDPWGNYERTVEATTNVQTIQYTGKQLDEDGYLFYFNARYYDPALGRFVGEDKAERDPLEPIRYNPYVYCVNNPLTIIDPDGLYDVIFVKVDNPKYRAFESTALIYPNGAVQDSVSGLSMQQIKAMLGNPIKTIENMSTVPDNPKDCGTVAEGVYFYKQESMFTDRGDWAKQTFKLNNGNPIPQDPRANGGINNGDGGVHPHSVVGVYEHMARGGDYGDQLYIKGSEGCVTGLPVDQIKFFDFLMKDGGEGRMFINRTTESPSIMDNKVVNPNETTN